MRKPPETGPLPSRNKLLPTSTRLSLGDPGEFMRNRYIVYILSAFLIFALAGCKGNPETAKRKYLESGQKYMEKKQYEAASIQFKKALQIDPKFAEAHYQLGTAMLGMQHWQEGFKELTTAVEQDPNNMKARADLGN